MDLTSENICVCVEVTCTRYDVGPERTAGEAHVMRRPLEVAVTFRLRGGASGPEVGEKRIQNTYEVLLTLKMVQITYLSN